MADQMRLEPFTAVTVDPTSATPTLPAGLDAAIRSLNQVCQMRGGVIELEFRTEPSFGAALPTWGNRHQVVFLPIRPGGEPARGQAAEKKPPAPRGVSPGPESEVWPGRAGVAEIALGGQPPIDRIGALGVRSLRDGFLGGRRCRTAYFHHLRIHPEFRGGTTLARGYRAFRREAEKDPAEVTFTSILHGNRPARELLDNLDGRGPLPRYVPFCPYLTVFFPLGGPGGRWPRRDRGSWRDRTTTVRPLNDSDIPEFFDLYNEFAKTHDGSPPMEGFSWPGRHRGPEQPVVSPGTVVRLPPQPPVTPRGKEQPEVPRREESAIGQEGSAFGEGSPGRGRPKDSPARASADPRTEERSGGRSGGSAAGPAILGTWRNGRLVATLALWDQTPVKQVRLVGGAGWLPLVWRLARAILPLPAMGEDIPHVLFDPWCYAPGEERALGGLLEAALETATARGFRFAAWGVPVGHPASKLRRRFFHLPYQSTIFQVAWEKDRLYSQEPGRQAWFSLGAL